MANNIEVKINANYTGAGLAGSLTWKRLEKILRDAGEMRSNEDLNGFKADKQGINFYLNTK